MSGGVRRAPQLLELLRLLRDGELTVDGRLLAASNITLLGSVAHEGESVRCVYKPISGERPLWDFPDGTLAARETAAYELSEAAGWHVAPPTALRAGGPFGPGMCQLWIEPADTAPARVDVVKPEDVQPGWLPVLEAVDDDGVAVVLAHADHPALRRLALFDVVVNNADRKGGHVLAGVSGDVLGVDHGVCFHVEPKLRTVLWGWAGTELTPAERAELTRLRARLDGSLGETLRELLAPDEVAATGSRVEDLLRAGRMPSPTGRMPVPWPVF